MRRFLVIILLLLGGYCYSQIGVDLGFRSGLISSKSFRAFRNSYSDYLSNDLKSSIGAPTPSIGYGFAMNYAIVGVYGFANYGLVVSKTKAVFNSGAERHFILKESTGNIGIGYGQFDGDFSFGIGVGLSIGENKVNSYFQYTNGMKSYGNEKDLNGFYDRVHLGYVVDGFMAVNLFDNIMGYLKLDFNFGTLAGLNSPLQDIHRHKSGSYLSETASGLPTDYESFLNLQGTYEYPYEDYVSSDFSGLRVEIGLRFEFGNF